MKLSIFKPEDFGGEYGLCDHCMADATNMANHKLNQWLKENGKVVYSQSPDKRYWTDPHDPTTQGVHLESDIKALLICIEPIEKCAHPREKVVDPRVSKLNLVYYQCECGAKVQPSGFEEVR